MKSNKIECVLCKTNQPYFPHPDIAPLYPAKSPSPGSASTARSISGIVISTLAVSVITETSFGPAPTLGL